MCYRVPPQERYGIKVYTRCLGDGTVEVKLQKPKTPAKVILGHYSTHVPRYPGDEPKWTLHVEVEGQAVRGTPLVCQFGKLLAQQWLYWRTGDRQSKTVA
jgi:hypothetical protein